MKMPAELIEHLTDVAEGHGFQIEKVNFLNNKIFIMIGKNDETKKAQK